MKSRPGRHVAAFILLFLTKKPSYGFELLKDFEMNLPHNIIDSAAIYRCLKNLETNEFVKSEWDTTATGAAKKYYTITDSGYEELAEYKKDIEMRYQSLGFFLDSYESLENKK